ncbi:hypothetical protein EZ456_08230 [Pedobacter psychrodurus]|uniref:Lipoprotein n=1 Tax=Pedobacter psychrodurus TaxID=2530456 RepID=A0A4R0Q1I0_9SPHI|nr:hypothetical protein [Pedobacter psychrodurus]TCD27925.1 hypothetical protein EZ456_08230 [Pedobacter psychrodurus]
MKKKICMLLLGSIGLISFQGCKKDVKTDEAIGKTDVNNQSKEKLTKFLAITLGTTEGKVIYVDKDKEFIINGWFHKSLESVQGQYETANEYKANYEK